MAGPSWLHWVLVAAFLGVAGYAVVRLAAAHRVPESYPGCHRALDVAHLVMGLGMAVMCSPIGGPVPAAGWQTVFLLLAAWFLGSSLHRPRTAPIGWHGGSLHHALGALAMLYMLTAMPGDAHHMAAAWTHAHHAAAGPPLLGWVLAAYFAGSALLLGPRLLRTPAPARPRLPAVLCAPRTTALCQVTMALGMSYMVVPAG